MLIKSNNHLPKKGLYLLESAKSRALRALRTHVLTCPRALRAHVPLSPRALRALRDHLPWCHTFSWPKLFACIEKKIILLDN